VAIDVLKRSKALEPKAILDAITATDYRSIVGPVKWAGMPVKNVTKTPLVSGQWQRKGDAFNLVITQNETAPQIPVGGKLEVLT
jgi:branched-chain amino acid transport system substrate-binding protein